MKKNTMERPRRLRFKKKRLGTIVARNKRAVLPTIQEHDKLIGLILQVSSSSIVHRDADDDKASFDNHSSDQENSITVNFKKRVHDFLQDGRGIILITTQQRQELTNEINQDYTEILLAETGDHIVDVHLEAAKHVVNDFFAVQDVILRKAIMPSSMQDILFDVLEDFLYPRVSNHYNNKILMDKLTPRDTAKIVTWIEDFVDRMNKECPELEIRQSWEKDREQLIQHYLSRGVRREMNEILTRAMELRSKQDDVRQESQGHLATGFPEQVSFIYEQQLKVARELLPFKYQEVVLVACNQELANCVCDMQLEIMSNWKQMRSSYFCALLNDATRLSEQCEERNNLLLQRPELKESGQDLVRDLTELSLDTTRFLCEYMLYNLREPESILTSIGSVEWERSNERPTCAIDRTIATYEDFFEDLEQWILSSQYFFPKVLQHCFDMTLKTYLESFFANTMTKGIQDPTAVAKVLEKDHGRLKDFFHGSSICEKYHGSGGFHKQGVINDRLSIVQSMATLLDPINAKPPANMKGNIKAILSHFESGIVDGTAVVLHLLGLRNNKRQHQRLEQSIEWLKTISSALKELDDDNHEDKKSISSSSCLSVPDLRNSKYLHNSIRPPRTRIEVLSHRISAKSLPYADATLRLLLQSQRRSPVWFKSAALPQLLHQAM